MDVLDDLLALDEFAVNDSDVSRQRALFAVRDHIAQRDHGANVSDAADVVGVSQPTIRAWVTSGLLRSVEDTRPMRIELLSLASVKRALDVVRVGANDAQLAASVSRILRDRAAFDGAEDGLLEARSGTLRPIGSDLRAEVTAFATQRGS
jgi:DNA-binding transcriptional MerR regulator